MVFASYEPLLALIVRQQTLALLEDAFSQIRFRYVVYSRTTEEATLRSAMDIVSDSNEETGERFKEDDCKGAVLRLG